MSTSRYKSSIINIRIFHNWVKSTMIQETVRHLEKDYNINDPTLLDLAVGKGGDMFKWYGSNIYHVIGIDIDEESVKGPNGAIHRYSKLRRKLQQEHKKIPRYKFYVLDLSDPKNINLIRSIIKGRKHNIVSCQFAIHYFFRDQTSLDTLLKIVSSNIDKNGFFIGTTMDGDKLKEIMKKDESIGNAIFNIKRNTYPKKENPYGNKYTVTLGKKDEDHYFSKSDSIEFMVNMDELKKMCKKYDLHFVGTIPFERWYELYLKDKPRYKMTDEDKTFSFLNISFIFKKKKNI